MLFGVAQENLSVAREFIRQQRRSEPSPSRARARIAVNGLVTLLEDRNNRGIELC
jgi:hypothetical protein